MPLGHLYVSVGEMSVETFCPVFDCVVCFDTELHELFVDFED